MNTSSVTNPKGNLVLYSPKPVGLKQTLILGLPNKSLPEQVNEWRKSNWTHLWRGLKQVLLSRALKLPAVYGTLYLTVQEPIIPPLLFKELLQEYLTTDFISFPDFALTKGFQHQTTFLGLASFRVVTTTGVNFIVDAFQNSVEVENLKYHALGTGSTGELIGDTALVTELTTEYTGNVRATGTTTEGASANIYRTVGTNTLDGTPGAALREHGIFDQAATGGGTLLDRTVYGAITLSSGDSLQSTYDLTFTGGS